MSRPYHLLLLLPLLLGAGVVQARNNMPPLAQNGTVTINDLMGADDPRLLLTLDAAVAQVRRETGGRVLSAKTVNSGGKIIHRIKVLTPQKQVQIHEIEAGDAR